MNNPDEMPARIAAFLAEQEPEWRDIEVVAYEVMTGGYSRLLGKAHVRHAEGEEVLVLRGDPPPGRALVDTDRAQEFEVITTVAEHGVRTPRTRYFDDAGQHLGTRALVIEYTASDSFLPYASGGGSLEGLNIKLADALASYHRLPVASLPARLERPADWNTYIGHRIDEWRRTADAHVEDLPILRYVAAWLDAHRPPEVPLTLIHGDLQSANLMLAADGHFEILDWELASIGDPREDIGYFKAVAQIAPPDLLDDAGVMGFCERYRELTGLNEAQVNPVTVAYFLILGVVGTVRRLLEGGAAYSRDENTLLASLFNLNSVVFGSGVWIGASKQLEPVLAAMKGAM
jgi:aminoglycoside phosphotransferase (APT) family kinase protein